MGRSVCGRSGATPAREVCCVRFAVIASAMEAITNRLCRGVAKLVKAPDFDSGMRRFESFRPCHFLPHVPSNSPVGASTSRRV